MAEAVVTARSHGRVQADGPVGSDAVQWWGRACAAGLRADTFWFPAGRTTFRGRIHRRELVDLSLLEMEADPFALRWRRDSEADGYLGVSVSTRTFSERIVLGDRSEHVISTSVCVWDAAAMLESEILAPMAQTVLLVPKRALPTRRFDLFPMKRDAALRDDAPPLQLLRAFMLAAAAQADHLGAATTSATRNAIVELLTSVLDDRCEPPSAVVTEGMRRSIIHWVEDRLHLGQVAPAQVADQHGISVRTLHRLFADRGETFGEMVRRRRLEQARRDLVATDDMVQTIAMRWGYADASQLITVFKRVHGVTPTSYRRSCRSSVPR
ncbi:helix-turn-helix domain-containing protein [Streptomyces sp. NPDC005811]|uniref:helix-turn-helix domain-containing protein n=1 Tax=Streptomyces sp. NPDC005811 TaxID=3154565 RepID=UPI0033FA6AF3